MHDIDVQKDLDKFSAALDKFTGSINDPDSKGRYVLIESVKANLMPFVEDVIEAGADVTVNEESTGKTALHYAFAQGDVSVSVIKPLEHTIASE